MSHLLANSDVTHDVTDDVTNGGKSTRESRLETLKGLFSALGFVYSIVTTGTLVSLLERSVGDFQLFMWRHFFGLIYCCVILLYRRELPRVPRTEIVNVVLYTFFSNGSSGIYVAVTLISASSAQCIEVTSSILSGLVLYGIFLKERITWKNIMCAVICVCGVILVVQPDFLFHNSLHSQDTFI